VNGSAVAVACALVPACGEGLVDQTLPGDTDDGGEDGETGVPEVDETGDASTGTAPDPGMGDDTGGATGEPGSDGGAGLDECDLDCGEGTCEIDRDGLPTCACAPGSALLGLTCLPCTTTAGPADVEIVSVPFSLRVLVDHEPAPADDYEDGVLWLRDALRGDEIELGNSHDGMLSAAALPGTYDLVWQAQSGGSVVPTNAAAIVGRVQVREGGLQIPEDESDALTLDGNVLQVDIPTIELSGEITIDQGGVPPSQYDNGRVYLLDPESGDEITLGDTKDGAYSVRIVPGVYEVHYQVKVSNGGAPLNENAFITSIDASGEGEKTQSIDIGATTITGDFLLAGNAAPASVYERGRIAIRDVATGDEIEVGHTSDGSFSIPVVPGTYEVLYGHVIGQMVPKNSAARLEPLLVPEGDTHAHDVDVPITTVAGAFTVGGLPAPADPGNSGELRLRSVEGDDEVVLGSTSAGTYSAIVVDGSYEVFYAQQTSTGDVPANTNARIGDALFVLPADTIGDIDVPVVEVAGVITLDGLPPPTSEYDDGRIYLRNSATGDSVLLGNTRLGAIAATVVPGDYEVFYVVEAAGAVVPQNSGAKLAEVTVPAQVGPFALPLDIPVATLAGKITVGGEAPPQVDTDRANLVLQDTQTDDTVFLGPVSAGEFAVPLTAGTYIVWYESIESSGLLPGNVHAGVACFDLVP
jgi:hypothetical protein